MATVAIDGKTSMQVRLIDCVGYIVPSALGYLEDNAPRMVKTPWFDEEVPFNMAAELGTKKVITEHSTIGLVVTTDGSITRYSARRIRRGGKAGHRRAARRSTSRLSCCSTCMEPTSPTSVALGRELTKRYGVPVCPVNCLDMGEEDMLAILEQILRQFPLKEVDVELPRWLLRLPADDPVRRSVMGALCDAAAGRERVCQLEDIAAGLRECPHIECRTADGDRA